MSFADRNDRTRRAPWRTAAGVLRDTVVALLIWLLWQLPIYGFLNLPPRLATVWLCGVAAFFLWCYAVPQGWGSARRRATARVRPIPRAAWPWIAVLAPVMSAASFAASEGFISRASSA